MKTRLSFLATLTLVSSALAGQTTPGSLHVRGTVESFKGGVLTVRTTQGSVRVQLSKAPVVSVIPANRSQIKAGSFLGIASVAGPSGAQTAREVVVFPEAARGSGEGSYPWDLPNAGGSMSKMTNGTASASKMTNGTVSSTGGGTMLTLGYKSAKGSGTQTIHLPANVPVVTFEPGTSSQLVPGAHVIVFAHVAGGATIADRTLVGKNGLVPPM